jgi:hypothetical protein
MVPQGPTAAELVPYSCATASGHAGPGCSIMSQVSAGASACLAGLRISPLERKTEPRAVAIAFFIVPDVVLPHATRDQNPLPSVE